MHCNCKHDLNHFSPSAAFLKSSENRSSEESPIFDSLSYRSITWTVNINKIQFQYTISVSSAPIPQKMYFITTTVWWKVLIITIYKNWMWWHVLDKCQCFKGNCHLHLQAAGLQFPKQYKISSTLIMSDIWDSHKGDCRDCGHLGCDL